MLLRLATRSAALVLPTACLIVACPAPAASVAPTRSEYVASVEPICKEETQTHRGVLEGVEGMVEAGRFEPAARRLRRAGVALREALRRIAPLPRPVADRARLARWFGYARNGSALMGEVATALEREDRSAAQRLAGTMLKETRRANATVVGFDFKYCRLNPAHFA